MKKIRSHPHLYEINTAVWLRRLSEQYNRSLSLATIPEREWKRLWKLGFDLIWLMGIWRRSPGARMLALSNPPLRSTFSELLPGWTDQDIPGSPYAVYGYSLDAMFGKEDDLKTLKSKLNHLGLGLILDFVPNHLAFDHPWIFTHPERFVRGEGETVSKHPDWFYTWDQRTHFAHGRDPYFGPWTDTAQVNFFSQEMREALQSELMKIAETADGVRCDMAMLGINRIFEGIWKDVLGPPRKPNDEFWPGAIQKIRARHPNFIFIAEVYWELEWELQQMGFDYTYDKKLYDRLAHAPVQELRGHLKAEELYQRRSVRFIENHDEPRAPSFFGKEKSLAAAAVTATIPGLRFFYDGQLEGKKIRVPVHLNREPRERKDPKVFAFYSKLLSLSDRSLFHEGQWTLLEAKAVSPSNRSHENILTWSWNLKHECKLVAINYSSSPAAGRVILKSRSRVLNLQPWEVSLQKI